MKNPKKFWNWLDVKDEADAPEERVLEINGEIASIPYNPSPKSKER